MPISAVQEMKAWRVKTGDIPLSARIEKDFGVHQLYGLNSFTGEDTRAFAQGFQQLADMRGAAAERARLKILGSMSPMFDYQSDIRTSLPGDTSQKVNRQMLITRSFFNSINEGMWEGARALVHEYGDELPGLKNVFYPMALEKLRLEGFQKDIAYQCVAFIIGYLQEMLDTNINNLGAIGAETAEILVNKYSNNFENLKYKSGSRENYIPSGSVISHWGISTSGGRSKYGHTFIVLKDLGDKILIIEQAGELAKGPEPYLMEDNQDNLSSFTWEAGSAAFKPSKNQPYPRYVSYKSNEDEYTLTMMPRIRYIDKSYFEDKKGIRTPTIAAPKSEQIRNAVKAFGEKYAPGGLK